MEPGLSTAKVWRAGRKGGGVRCIDQRMDVTLDTVRRDVVALLPRLRRFALSLTGNATDADDLVQDAVERGLRNLHRWQPGTRLDSWMFRLTQNIWIDAVRARKVRKATSLDSDEAVVVSVDGARAMETRLAFTATAAAMAKLPEEQRVAVALVLVDGMPYRDAAEVLGVPIGTLTSRLFRARAALAQALGGEGAQPSEVLT
jgi:RNA polymerase sigma-70 factor (ECF subfamily)